MSCPACFMASPSSSTEICPSPFLSNSLKAAAISNMRQIQNVQLRDTWSISILPWMRCQSLPRPPTHPFFSRLLTLIAPYDECSETQQVKSGHDCDVRLLPWGWRCQSAADSQLRLTTAVSVLYTCILYLHVNAILTFTLAFSQSFSLKRGEKKWSSNIL